MSQHYDCIVIGAGHNGLTCAATLARAGKSVLVLEAAATIGGAAATRSFAPGYSVSACAHLLHGLPADLVAELNLHAHGLEYAAQAMPTWNLADTGMPLRLQAGQASGAQLSSADKDAYPLFIERMQRFAGILLHIMQMVPPRLSLEQWSERVGMLGIAWKVRRLGKRDMRELLRIIGMNMYDLLGEHFESDALRGALAMDAALGSEHGPRAPGTVLNYLYRLAGQLAAGKAGIALPKGGMGMVSAALASALRAAGGELRTNAKVARINVDNDRACGVLLETGQSINAGAVLSSADPRTTFLRILGTSHLDTGFVRRVSHLRNQGRAAKLHLALASRPDFRGLEAGALGARLLIAPSADAVERAFNPCKYREVPMAPAMEISLPTVSDPTLAPAGKHVLSAIVQFVPYDLGPDPQAARAQLLENCLATLERHCPNIRALVVASELLTPSDLEAEFGMSGGHWHHAALTLDQFFFTRPLPGAAQYATPLAGLYLCGAGSHPGGGVMGIAGRNAAQQLLREGK